MFRMPSLCKAPPFLSAMPAQRQAGSGCLYNKQAQGNVDQMPPREGLRAVPVFKCSRDNRNEHDRKVFKADKMGAKAV